MFRVLTGVFLFLGVLGAVPGWAQLACRQVHRELPLVETSIEIESSLTEKTVELITSADGTLKTLFDSVASVPVEVRDYIGAQNRGAVLEFPLEALPASLKVQTIRESIIARKLKFNQSAAGGRVIPGIKVKEEYQRRYELRASIDMGSPQTVTDGRMLEFHLRSKKSSGELLLQANQVYAKMGTQPGPMHMHIVMPLMSRWLQENPKLNTWRFVEYWRRMNLTFEMRDVVEKGVAVIENRAENYTNFAPLGAEEVRAGFNYLYAIGSKAYIDKNGNPGFVSGTNMKQAFAALRAKLDSELGTRAKMGWIGFWGHDKYDAPGLMGFEFRFLDGKYNNKELQDYLNGFPEKMQERDFGLSEEGINNWFYQTVKTEADRRASTGGSVKYLKQIINESRFPELLFSRLSPHRSYESMFVELPFEFQRILLGMDKKKVSEAFNNRGRLRYLIHDWSLDPILIGKDEQLTQIQNAQLRGLRRWARGENETQVIQEFLIESGLYFSFAESIGFQP